jgi:hypothetical protein
MTQNVKKILLIAIVAVVIIPSTLVALKHAHDSFVIRSQGVMQGTLKERTELCGRYGTYKNKLPFSSHLVIRYFVDATSCFRKEPDLTPNTNTISLQILDGTGITPVYRIINHAKYTQKNWQEANVSFKKDYGQNATVVSASDVPIFSKRVQELINPQHVIKVTDCITAGQLCYYFTDKEGIYSFMPYSLVSTVDQSRISIDYE